MYFTPQPEKRLAKHFLYLADQDLQLANDFEIRLKSALAFIAKSPEACRVRKHQVRRKNLVRFKRHYIAFMIWQGQIVIITIGHASRRPYYWYRRPKEFRQQQQPT